MSNTYTPDGQFIIDTIGERWAVNAWHITGPLNGTPAGISALDENGNWSGEIAFKATDENRTGWWLARPPLPPVPKTQETKDTIIPENLPVLELGVQIVVLEAALAAEREKTAKLTRLLIRFHPARSGPGLTSEEWDEVLEP